MPSLSFLQIILLIALIFLLFGDVPGLINRLKHALKGLTRTNAVITQSSIADFIDTLNVSDELKAELKAITPQNYTGI